MSRSDVCAAAAPARSCPMGEKVSGLRVGRWSVALCRGCYWRVFGEERGLLQSYVCVGANVRSLAGRRCLLPSVVQYASVTSSAVATSDEPSVAFSISEYHLSGCVYIALPIEL